MKTIKGERTLKFSFSENMKVYSPYINKLFGISSNANVHDRSIRLGWRFIEDKDQFELRSYTYTDGEREIHKTDPIFVNVGEEVTLTFKSDDRLMSMMCKVDEERQFGVEMFRKKGGKLAVFDSSFLTHPYWGGIEPSPSYMSFVVKGIDRAKWIQVIEDFFSLSPNLTTLIIGVILFLLTIVLGKIYAPLIFVAPSVLLLFYLIFINQWVYIKVSAIFRRLRSNT